jgi:hypothetical protein
VSLVGRRRELAAIDRTVLAAAGGRGGIVVVEGPAGIGKTTLLAAAADAARGRGLTVRTARGAPLERDLPFGVVRRLLDPLAHRAAAEPDRARGAAALAVRAFDIGVAGGGFAVADVSFATLHGLYWLTADAAAWAPLLLVVDDDHSSPTRPAGASPT